MKHTRMTIGVLLFSAAFVLLACPASGQGPKPRGPAEQPEPGDTRVGVPTQTWRRLAATDHGTVDTTATQGFWRGWFDLPGGQQLGFNFDLDFRRDYFRTPLYSLDFVNGTEYIPAILEPIGEERKPRYFLHMKLDGSDAYINAAWESGGIKMAGEYVYWRDTDAGRVEYRLPFTAINSDARRFDTPEALEPDQPVELETDWRVNFESREGPAVMTLRLMPDGRHVQGTVMTPTGDDGVLFGVFHEGRLRLSRFAGDSGLLYDATLQPDGSLIGTFHSLAHHSETFTATPARDAALPDLFGLTRWNEGVSPAELAFRDPAGTERSLADVAPGPALVYVFGTWCHNCADATRYLNELHDRYGTRLSIVGLAFETPDAFEEQAARVEAYTERKSVGFPVLVAGQRDKSQATESLGALDRVRAYPTFAFIDDQGRVTDVHQGFIGPAAPERHAELRRAFESRIDAMLAGG